MDFATRLLKADKPGELTVADLPALADVAIKFGRLDVAEVMIETIYRVLDGKQMPNIHQPLAELREAACAEARSTLLRA